MNKNNLIALRRMHGAIYEWWQKKKNDYFDKHVETIGKKRYQTRRIEIKEDYPVDLVVMWVDPSDPKWIKEKEKYTSKDEYIKKDNGSVRYRDWELFKYFFRGIAKYAKWIHNIYFVTWGHVPDFLNVDNPKIKVIKHEEFIPLEYLPLFNSGAIELNLFRIKGLSEHFIYLNDDMFFCAPSKKSDFFSNGLPNIAAVCHYSFPNKDAGSWEHRLFNDVGLVNSAFDFRSTIKRCPEKWFPPFYEKDYKWNRRAYEDGRIHSFYTNHLGYPLRCSTIQSIWQKYYTQLDSACKFRFRTMANNTIHLVKVWEAAQGTFEPVPKDYFGHAYPVSLNNIETIKKSILSESDIMVCINDSESLSDSAYKLLKRQFAEIFQEKFPEKCEFEL